MLGRIFRWLFGTPEPVQVCEWCSRGAHAHDEHSGRCINASRGCECTAAVRR